MPEPLSAQSDPAADSACPAPTLSRPLRWLLASVAIVCFAIGWVGVFVPGLPTTVFWLIAVLLAGKSCPFVQQWVYRRGRLGATVEDIVVRKAMTRAAKIHAVIGMWVMLAISAGLWFWFGHPATHWLIITLPMVGLGVTTWIVFGLRVLPPGRTLTPSTQPA
ncbi:MAG: YbaN family protein [Planctomycetota bacterium]